MGEAVLAATAAVVGPVMVAVAAEELDPWLGSEEGEEQPGQCLAVDPRKGTAVTEVAEASLVGVEGCCSMGRAAVLAAAVAEGVKKVRMGSLGKRAGDPYPSLAMEPVPESWGEVSVAEAWLEPDLEPEDLCVGRRREADCPMA